VAKSVSESDTFSFLSLT